MNTDIKPRLTLFDTLLIVINLVIGIGIFRTPALIASKVQNSEMFFISWVVGGIAALCGALTFAEVGARLPKPGGLYKVVSIVYHPLAAFMLNWTYILTLAVSTAGVALIGAEYMSPLLFPDTQNLIKHNRLIVGLVILGCFALNFIGIRAGATTQKILSFLKVLLILVICSSIFFVDSSLSPHITPGLSSVGDSLGFGTALVAVFYTFGGYQCTLNFGADVQNPIRNIPRAIIMGLLIIIALYFALNAVYVRVLGFENLSSSHLVAADVARAVWGDTGLKITSIAIFLSVLAYVNVYIMQTPRVLFAMAEDRIFPSAFKKVNKRTQVQEVALIAFTLLILLSTLIIETFETLVNYVIIIDSITLSAVAFSIFLLRKKQKDDNYQGYKLPLYPWLPLIFISFLGFIVYSIFLSQPLIAVQGIALILAGAPIYFLINRFSRD
jgi:basic amino acid/polyamine antiporter, APA family